MSTRPAQTPDFPADIADCDSSLVASERWMMTTDDLQSLRADLELIQSWMDRMYEAYASLVRNQTNGAG